MSKYSLVKNSLALNARVNGRTEKFYVTAFKVDPKKWNKKKQRIDGEGDVVKAQNKHLITFQSKVDIFILDANTNGLIITRDDVKSFISESFQVKQGTKPSANKSFISYLQWHIDNGIKATTDRRGNDNASKNTIKSYKTVLGHILKYLESIGKTDLSFSEMKDSWYKGFQNYLKKTNLSVNSRDNQIKYMIAMLNKAFREKKHFNQDHLNIPRIQEEGVVLYLTQDEVKQLSDIQLNGTKEQVRDLFIFSCLTGVSFEDSQGLTRSNFTTVENVWYLSYRRGKNKGKKDEVFAPILYYEAILLAQKYDYCFRKISNQKANVILKEICNENSLLQNTIDVNLSYMEGNYKRADIVSYHDSRRTFCTNQFLKGVPLNIIALCSGHKKESSLLTYITKDEKAKSIWLIRNEKNLPMNFKDY